MNSWQLAQQIKHELAQVAWPSGSQDVVFGARSVFVYAGTPPSAETHPPGFPFALVTIGGGTPDPDDPDIIEQVFSVVTAVEVAGDPLGEHSVIGSSRADYGKSAGAGVAEVAERVRAAIEKLTAYDGAAVTVTGSGVGAPASLGTGRQIAFDEFSVTALCTSRPRYTAPQELQVAGESGETWSWRGEGTGSRFDFLRYRLGFVAGSTPVATPDDLDTVIYTGTATETVATPVAGRTYHIFADYNGHGGTTVAASSPADVGSYLIV